MWHPPDPYEPTSEIYRLMPSRRPVDDDPVIDLTLPRQPWWRKLAARARPVSWRAVRWACGLFTAALAVVIGSLVYSWLSSR